MCNTDGGVGSGGVGGGSEQVVFELANVPARLAAGSRHRDDMPNERTCFCLCPLTEYSSHTLPVFLAGRAASPIGMFMAPSRNLNLMSRFHSLPSSFLFLFHSGFLLLSLFLTLQLFRGGIFPWFLSFSISSEHLNISPRLRGRVALTSHSANIYLGPNLPHTRKQR